RVEIIVRQSTDEDINMCLEEGQNELKQPSCVPANIETQTNGIDPNSSVNTLADSLQAKIPIEMSEAKDLRQDSADIKMEDAENETESMKLDGIEMVDNENDPSTGVKRKRNDQDERIGLR